MVSWFPEPLVELGRELLCALCPLLRVFPCQRHCLCLSHRTDVPGPGSTPVSRHYRNWNPPLLGNLPEDFLRILPQQTAGTQVRFAAPSSPWCAWSTIPSHAELQLQHSETLWVLGMD